MIRTFSDKQNELAGKHFHLVGEYLRRQGLEDNDQCYDAAVNGFLHAVQAYLENPELQEAYRFPEMATRRINTYVVDYLNKEMKQRQSMRSISFDAPVRGAGHLDISDILGKEQQSVEDRVQDRLMLQAILAGMTPRQRHVLVLQEGGYSLDEIATAFGLPVRAIISILQKIRHQANAVRVTIEVGV